MFKKITLTTFNITCGNDANYIPFVMATIGIDTNGEKTIRAAQSRYLIVAIFMAIWKNRKMQNINFLIKIYAAAKIIFQINYPKKIIRRK
ncbi:MAG: hypothetical protein V1891_04860 [bacterium]